MILAWLLHLSWSMRFTPAVVTALLLATGCMGGIDNTDPTPDAGMVTPTTTARTLYKTNVHPVMNRCTGAACHSVAGATGTQPKFADPNADTSYTAIVAAPTIVGGFNSQAGLFTKITAGHNGMVYSTAEISSINAWLAKETEERSSMAPIIDPVEVMKKWSGCMTLANFQAAQMATKFGNLGSSDGRKCSNCHNDGGFVFIATTAEQIYFATISKHKDYLGKYFTVDATGKVIINMTAFTNAGVSIQTHPRFDPMVNAGMPALQTFYTSTMAASTAGTCAAPTLID